MMTQRNSKYSCRGFTLVELAMVLMIVGLLLGGLIVPLSAQMEQRRATETQKSLEEIREALVGYAVINGQFPCPADPTIPTGGANAGTPRAGTPPCTASNSTGVVPWVTLGVNETDAWGNRFTYRLTPEFADAIADATYGCVPTAPPANASFALCSPGTLDVLDAAGGANVAIDVPAVVISHGKNSGGAYTQQGTQVPISGNADEQENSDGDTNTSYVSHTPTSGFDDQVTWVSNNVLMNRMVTAGKLP
jgi:prepilin-type N-terminal cleavage/methylation domain-containing protein